MKNSINRPTSILLIFTVVLQLAGVTLKLFHIATALGNIFLWLSIGLGLSAFVSGAIPNVSLRLKVLSGLSALCVLIGFTIRAFFTTYEAFGNFLIIVAMAFVGAFAVNKFFPPKTRQ
jgi:hypothetical protein